MRVLLSGGGTGGHINPALAIGGKIKEVYKDAVIEYVGTKKGLETKLVPKEGYKIHYVKVEGLKRKLTLENIIAAYHAVTSVFEAKKIIKNFKPDIVIGTGGYVCWPVLKAAADMHIPTFVHESNAIPGVSTKMLSKYVDKILLNFKESEKYLESEKEKLVVVGNPVKQEMFTLSSKKCREKLGISQNEKVVLSYGGSLGAKVVNETVFEIISGSMLPDGVRHIHATGNGYWDKAKEKFLSEGFSMADDNTMVKGKTEIKRYIYNMPELMACADIVICRAGAMTVSEIAAMGKAAVFIPSPNVTDNHQYKNAKVLKDAKAAELIEEKNLSSEILSDTIQKILSDEVLSAKMKDNVKVFADPLCLDKIVNVVKELTSK
ncbi:MAG: undecaprenyldiphospho-muramoylpentapeptide beta-N-acetylglucosaminyltransferase [Ruminococcaceae bacterium]|nr:undecaprenyldiphospho-muramoylpentapeptide beta-N-acetylglucosaminyltransferase [Oscillospiraceae bacterium]